MKTALFLSALALIFARRAARRRVQPSFNQFVQQKRRLVRVQADERCRSKGRFQAHQGLVDCRIDPKPTNARPRSKLDLAGIDAGSPEPTTQVAGKLWFNTKAYPTARFSSPRSSRSATTASTCQAKLSIKGRTHESARPPHSARTAAAPCSKALRAQAWRLRHRRRHLADYGSVATKCKSGSDLWRGRRQKVVPHPHTPGVPMNKLALAIAPSSLTAAAMRARDLRHRSAHSRPARSSTAISATRTVAPLTTRPAATSSSDRAAKTGSVAVSIDAKSVNTGFALFNDTS